jgi:hypothetical protein
MKVYCIVYENRLVDTISGSAVYSKREDAAAHLVDPKRMQFSDRAAIVEHELDEKAPVRA